ncbi:MAG: hypoxanthine phosphoribosyltransferase [candidate division Zixibacteria bacterium]|nr:hypoxanthine phosphoribosyltransferase [candidate division Zixibacteria bacterium]
MKVLISEKKLAAKVKALAKQIRNDYEGEVPIFCGILKGSFLFMADLVREYASECEIDFMAVSSYGNAKKGSGVVRLIKDLHINVKQRHILIIEDIIDSGLTSTYIKQYLKLRKPKSVEFVTLLDKSEARKVKIDIKYVGFNIPNKFVIGYGLDYAEKYRQLPYIAECEDEERLK